MKTVRIGIRCDSGPGIGVGHLIRCLALAEELRARNTEVVVLGDLGGVTWAERQVTARGLVLLPAPPTVAEFVATAGALALDAVVLDSYTLDPGCGAALRLAGTTVLAIVDGDARGQSADLYLDQNLGAQGQGRGWLTGPQYVLLRDSVRMAGNRLPQLAGQRSGGLATRHSGRDGLAVRTAGPNGGNLAARAAELGGGSRTPRVLGFFGGTDAAGAAPTLARLLVRTGSPFEATIVTTGTLPPHPAIEAIPPTDELARLALGADLVVTACGSGVWEMLHLGLPMALVWVAENQRAGYQRVVESGLALGLGHIDDVRDLPGGAVSTLNTLLTDEDVRKQLTERGKGLIDGRGRERVADALLARLP